MVAILDEDVIHSCYAYFMYIQDNEITDRRTDRQADRQTDRQTSRQTSWCPHFREENVRILQYLCTWVKLPYDCLLFPWMQLEIHQTHIDVLFQPTHTHTYINVHISTKIIMLGQNTWASFQATPTPDHSHSRPHLQKATPTCDHSHPVFVTCSTKVWNIFHTWCSHDVHMMLTWCSHDAHMMLTWCSHDCCHLLPLLHTTKQHVAGNEAKQKYMLTLPYCLMPRLYSEWDLGMRLASILDDIITLSPIVRMFICLNENVGQMAEEGLLSADYVAFSCLPQWLLHHRH